MDNVPTLFLPLHVASLEIRWELDPSTFYQEIPIFETNQEKKITGY